MGKKVRQMVHSQIFILPFDSGILGVGLPSAGSADLGFSVFSSGFDSDSGSCFSSDSTSKKIKINWYLKKYFWLQVSDYNFSM